MIATDGIGINQRGSNPACGGMGKSLALDIFKSVVRTTIEIVEHFKTYLTVREQ